MLAVIPGRAGLMAGMPAWLQNLCFGQPGTVSPGAKEYQLIGAWR